MSDTLEVDVNQYLPPIPRQVREAARRAEALAAQANTTVVEQPAEPAPTGEPGPIETPPLGQGTPPALPPPVATPEPPAAPAATPGTPEPEETRERRYHSLQGRFNQGERTVGALREQLGEATRRIDQLTGLIATLNTAPAPANNPPPEPVAIPQEDIDEYGSKHGTDDYKWRACLIPCEFVFKKANHSIPVTGGFLRKECQKLFSYGT